MKHVSNRDLGYAWLDGSGELARSGDGTNGPIAQYGGVIQFVKEVSVPPLTGASPRFEVPLFSWSRALRRTPFPNIQTSSLFVREVEVFAGAAYCSGPAPSSPNGAGVNLRFLTSTPGAAQNIFSWAAVTPQFIGPASRRFGAPTNSVDSALLKDQDRMVLSFAVELVGLSLTVKEGVYRVMVLAYEI